MTKDAPVSAPSVPYRPNKHFQHVVDSIRPCSSSSFIALTPTNTKDEKQVTKLPPQSIRSQSVPATSNERSKYSPKHSYTAMETDEWFIVPSYVCSIHSTNDGLTESYRHATLTKEEAIQVVVKQIRNPHYTYISPLTFILSSHHVSHEFKVEYNEYRAFVKTIGATPVFSKSISELYQSKMLEDSFSGALRRAMASADNLSKELATALHDLVQIPQLAAHPLFLKLAHIESYRSIYEVLVHGGGGSSCLKEGQTPAVDDDNDSDTTEPTSLDGLDCHCSLYSQGITLFGSHVANEPLFTSKSSSDEDEDGSDSQSTVEKVLCIDLIQSRSLLSFYTDSMYTLDKSSFNSGNNYTKCDVLGFGSTLLFQVLRISKTEWHVVEMCHLKTPLLKMQLQKQGPQKPVVALFRCMAESNECIGLFRKSWRRGYEFQLLSELLTQGRITTSLSIVSGLVNHKHRYNVHCDGNITSAALSVPLMSLSKQRLHVSDGADVLLHIGIATTFDILASARPFHRSEFIYS